MTVATKRSYCRFCHAGCAIEVDVEGDQVVRVRGDADNALYQGFTCPKGRELPAQHNHPKRLLQSLKRRPDGSFEPITTAQAINEIAERIAAIIASRGPRAVASYAGTACFQNGTALAVIRGFQQAIGSPSFYTSVTIDQPAKVIEAARFGTWGGGFHSFKRADVALILGNNPLVSNYGPPGSLPGFHPWQKLKQARARGLRLICVDPRRTELAAAADLHLAIRPGEDSVLLAAMIRLILDQRLHDAAFCDQYVGDLDALRAAVAPFTTKAAATRCGVAATDIEAAARLFAAGPRGSAVTGTGTNMAPHSSLTEHLCSVLNIICGRCNRAGEPVDSMGMMTGLPRKTAQVIPPDPNIAAGEPARVRGLHSLLGEMPTATLPDEILTAGEGQIRALINAGGNPVVAFPDQQKTVDALESLELLVSIDPHLTQTSRISDYIIAPTLSLERADVPMTMDIYYEEPYSQYTPAIVPPRGDVIEEWRFYQALSDRLGVTITLPGGDLNDRDDTDSVLDKVCANARIPVAELRRHDGGRIYDELRETVAPGDPDDNTRFTLAPPVIASELGGLFTAEADTGDFGFRLVSRREKNALNSVGPHLDRLRARIDNNDAHIHPDELAGLDVDDGQLIRIRSARGSIVAVARADAAVRPGVVSMSHCWGDRPERDNAPDTLGSCVARLIDNAAGFDPFTGMPVMSAIPVDIAPHVPDIATDQGTRDRHH